MARSFSREQLHEMVWSRPVRTIASEYGISDVAFAKVCKRHGIPLPQRGYWAKREAGQKLRIEPLPARGLGMPQIIRTGRNHWERYAAPENLDEIEIDPLPIYPETIDDVEQRAKSLVGAVSIPRNLDRPHPVIARLLKSDEARRAEQAKHKYLGLSFGPLFDFPFERRRLRLLSGLFLALQRHGVDVSALQKDPSDFEAKVGEQYISIRADAEGVERLGWRNERDAARPASAAMSVSLNYCRTDHVLKSWKDKPDDPVERYCADIVVSILTLGEKLYREHEKNHHEWLVRRKEEIIEEKRKRREAETAAAAEARAKAEKARVGRLLREASALRHAQDIRAYVKAVRAANEVHASPVPNDQFEEWASWALDTADGIDPVLSRSFLSDFEKG